MKKERYIFNEYAILETSFSLLIYQIALPVYWLFFTYLFGFPILFYNSLCLIKFLLIPYLLIVFVYAYKANNVFEISKEGINIKSPFFQKDSNTFYQFVDINEIVITENWYNYKKRVLLRSKYLWYIIDLITFFFIDRKLKFVDIYLKSDAMKRYACSALSSGHFEAALGDDDIYELKRILELKDCKVKIIHNRYP